MVKIGIVGMGSTIGIASMHIKSYLLNKDKATITALYDILPERAQAYKEKFALSDAVVYNTYEELLKNVDAISICTPNATHVPLSVKALQAGKHVLCEKPFAPTPKECEDAIKYAELSQKVCMIGLCYRGIPALKYMKRLIDDGFFKTVYNIRGMQGGWRIGNPEVRCEWRMQESLSGPGAVADFGSHMLDIVDWLLRDITGPYTQVQSMSDCFIKERLSVKGDVKKAVTNDDVAVFNTRMQSGTLGSFTTSRLGCEHTIEIFGDGGYIGFDGSKPLELTVQKRGETKNIIQIPEDIKNEIPAGINGEMFLINFDNQIKEYLSAIVNETPISTNFERGLYVQKLIDAMVRSNAEEKTINIDFS